MVTINFTIVVQIVLFLLFLWAAHRIAFRPMLQHLDDRDAAVREDEEVAVYANEQADLLSSQYSTELAAVRREAMREVDAARSEALRERVARIKDRRRAGDEALESTRAELQAGVAAQRAHYPNLVPGLVTMVEDRVFGKAAGDE